MLEVAVVPGALSAILTTPPVPVSTRGGDAGLVDGLLEWFAVHPPKSN